MSYQQIPVDLIDPSPFNKRRNVEKPLDSISPSGPVVPLKARPKSDGRFELVFGHRRLAELKRQGIPTAPVIIQLMDDNQVIEEQWEENHDREDFTNYETALSLKQMMDKLQINQSELARRRGLDQNWVNRHLAIIKLEKLLPGELLYEITEKQARVILAAPEELQSTVIDNVLEQYNAEKTLPSANEILKIISDLIKLSKQDEEPLDHTHVYDLGSTQCRVCGRELTAPESVKAGIGPICEKGQTPDTLDTSNTLNAPVAPEAPKPLTLEERAYALLDDLHTRFGQPSRSFMVETLRYQLHIYLPDSDNLIAKYKARAKAPVDVAPPFKLVEVKEEEPKTVAVPPSPACPICGSRPAFCDLDTGIDTFVESLVTEGVLPIGLAEKVEQHLRRNYKPVTLPPEHSGQGFTIKIEPEEDEGKEFDWAKVEEIDEKEDEDREEEEHEIEEEQRHQSTGPEEAP